MPRSGDENMQTSAVQVAPFDHCRLCWSVNELVASHHVDCEQLLRNCVQCTAYNDHSLYLYTRIGSNRGNPQSTIMYRKQNIPLTRMAQQHHHETLSQHTSQYSGSNDETQCHDPEPKLSFLSDDVICFLIMPKIKYWVPLKSSTVRMPFYPA